MLPPPDQGSPMRRFRSCQSLLAARPWLAGVVVLVLAGAFFLPALHHLVDHHDGDSGTSCPICILAAAGVVAVLAAGFVLAAAETARLAGPRPVAVAVRRRPRLVCTRAPPLSD